MISLRPATIEDLSLLQYWDTLPHVIASDPDDDWNWAFELGRDPEWREQLVADYNEIPIGFLQIIDPHLEETHYWGDIGPNKRAIDIWIGPAEYLGKGYGTLMMKMALERCFSHPEVNEVWIDPLASNTRAIRFYQRLGFRFTETRMFEEQLCSVHVINRESWQLLNG